MAKNEIYEKSLFTEVTIDHYDDIKNVFCVDAWRTNNDEEEGEVIATIDLKGEITWIDEDVKEDTFVKFVLEKFFDYHYFSAQSNCADGLELILKIICREDRRDFNILNKFGSMGYSAERLNILDCDTYAVGMPENGQFKTFTVEGDDKEETIREIVEWMLYDISTAVGEVFCIEVV